MDPLFFGDPERPLFGWLHLPAPGAVRRTAVVLCPPFGQEYVLAHRALHGLGRQLAAAGFATLRFDYSGTGDSSGDFEQADLATWQQDVATAMRTVRERTGCEDVVLVGMRLGGSLAASACRDHALAALVLWDPVVDGAAFVRELQIAHWEELHEGEPPAEFPEPLVEASGFPVSARLREQLLAVDLRATPVERGLPLLLLQTAGAGSATALPETWKDRGPELALRAAESPAVWEENERRVLVPLQALQQIVTWIEATA